MRSEAVSISRYGSHRADGARLTVGENEFSRPIVRTARRVPLMKKCVARRESFLPTTARSLHLTPTSPCVPPTERARAV